MSNRRAQKVSIPRFPKLSMIKLYGKVFLDRNVFVSHTHQIRPTERYDPCYYYENCICTNDVMKFYCKKLKYAKHYNCTVYILICFEVVV